MAENGDLAGTQKRTKSDSKGIGPITQYQEAMAYLAESKVPQMFRGLIAGLMVERPQDHYQYLDTKLEEIKLQGIENVDWESFVFHLHPSRDKLHEKFIKEPDSVQEKKGLPHFIDEEYEPQLFSLTEANE